MNFECLLLNAKAGNEDAITAILALFGLAFFGYKVVHDAPEHKNLCHNTPFCHWHYYLYKKVPAVFRP